MAKKVIGHEGLASMMSLILLKSRRVLLGTSMGISALFFRRDVGCFPV